VLPDWNRAAQRGAILCVENGEQRLLSP
jgi:hypothetical protein